MLLTGAAVTSGISAAMIVLTLRLTPDKYQFVAIWLAGGKWGKDGDFVLAAFPVPLLLLPFVIYKSQALNILNLGDSAAKGLGMRVAREQILLLAAAVMLAGTCVAVGGSIGFVGLIAPHLARRLVGSRYQAVLPAAALAGALLDLTADTLGRWLLQPAEIPTGIVVAVIGAPYFLYLLVRTRNGT